MMEYTGLQFSENEGRLSVSVTLATERPPLDVDRLRQLVAAAGYEGCLLFDEALAKTVEACNLGTSEIVIDLGERRDAEFKLEIAPDAMSAWVECVPAYGGAPVVPDDVFAALGAAGVTFGIDRGAVEKLCSATAAERGLVACGKPAEDGQDTRFELLVADTRDRTPRVDEHGLIDFRNQGAIPLVVADQPLMRRIPPTNGVPGCNVRGETIDPVPGRNQPFADNLLGSYVSREDPNLLLASVNGQPVRRGNGVMVEQVFRLRNVDVTTGNINFDGTVNVEGEVMPNMKVHATGDIIVGGVVDGAELEAGGDIRIDGGIIAHAKVRAGGAVAARFVENAQVYAGTVITIDDMALQADLQAMKQIIIGGKVPDRGRLSGGSARAMLLVQVPILGSAAGGVTTVLLGVNPELEAKYQALLQRLEKQKEEESNLEKLIKHLNAHSDKADMLEKVKATWQHALQVWGELLTEKEGLEKQLELIAGARLVVGVSVSGAVDLTFGKKMMHVRQSHDAGTFLIDGDHIVFTSGRESAKGHC